jgi:hypothetical protein
LCQGSRRVHGHVIPGCTDTRPRLAHAFSSFQGKLPAAIVPRAFRQESCPMSSVPQTEGNRCARWPLVSIYRIFSRDAISPPFKQRSGLSS